MFRRSKIKITPKIPQAKTNVDRVSDSSTIQQPTESTNDSSKVQLQQKHQINQHLNINTPIRGSVSNSNGGPANQSQTLEGPKSSGINQVDDQHHMDQMTSSQPIPDQSPPSNHPADSILNHTEIMANQDATNQITSPVRGNQTSSSYPATSGSDTRDSMISPNQIEGNQQNQNLTMRRNNAQGSSTPITSRSSLPPPPTPNPSSSNSLSGATPTIGTRTKGHSISRENLPPPSALPLQPSLPSSSSGINVRGGDTLESDQHLTTTIVRDDSHIEPKRSRKRIKLTPEDLLDRNSITLYHLIHASITRTKKNDKKKPKVDKKIDEATDDNIETNSDAGSKGLVNSSEETTRIDNNDDTMDSIMTTVSSASTIITGVDPSVEDETRERETIGPRVKVGPDGQLIIDEESLVIKKPKPLESTSIEEAVSGKTTYASFRKRPPTARWSKAETIEFYTALNLIGPDFSLMSTLFFNGKRTRTDLKNKFRRENKLNKPVIEKALYEADVEYCLAREAV